MTEVITKTIDHVFETAAGRRSFIDSQRGEVFGQLIIGNLFGKAFEVQAYKCNAAKVIIEGTLTLPFQGNLLIKRFAYFLKAFNGKDRLFNDCG